MEGGRTRKKWDSFSGWEVEILGYILEKIRIRIKRRTYLGMIIEADKLINSVNFKGNLFPS